jgi:hypothetical protein
MKAVVTTLCGIIIFGSAQATFTNGNVKKTKAKAETKKKKFTKVQKSISLFNAGITLPPKVFNGTPHLGVEVGFSVPLKKKIAKLGINYGADAGFFNQSNLQNGLYVKPNIALTIPVYKSFNLQPRVGAGLLFATNLNKEFKQEANGQYAMIGNTRTQFLGTAGLQANMNVYATKQLQYQAFVRYEFAAQTPFSAISSLLPMAMLHLGVSVKGK